MAAELGRVIALRPDRVVADRLGAEASQLGRVRRGERGAATRPTQNLIGIAAFVFTLLCAVVVTLTIRGGVRAVGVAALVVMLTVSALAIMAIMARELRRQDQRSATLDAENRALMADNQQLHADVAQSQSRIKALQTRETTLNTTLQYIDQGIMMVDSAGNVAVYNHRVTEMLSLPDELLATYPPMRAVLDYQWSSGEFRGREQSFLDFVRAGTILPEPHTYQRERPNGLVLEVRSLPLPEGGIVRTYTDITERRRAQTRIERTALKDELTGLPNRLSIRQTLERRLEAEPERTSLLYLNLDRFRLVNEARGYEAADALLVDVARRLVSAVPGGDVVGRVGGDEFAIVHETSGVAAEDVEALGLRLLQVLAAPHLINGARVTLSVSIGVATGTAGAGADGLLRSADIALYRAKDAGRNQLRRYEPAMAEAQRQRFQMEQSLREALGTDAFRLAYQPIISLATDQVTGFEALLRWTDPMRGEIPPNQFIPLAEATGLIVPLGRHVLEWACAEAATWPSGRRVAVNLSPVQFQDGRLAETVADVLRRSGLAPSRLEFEVTEGVLLDATTFNPSKRRMPDGRARWPSTESIAKVLDATGPVLETMTALREIGVSLTLDDFGTGHAGLSYLRRFPFEKIKIDKSFIDNLGRDRESDAVVEATLLLGERLQVGVVAEGVETEAQLAQLRQMRCPFVQGFLTGRPLGPEAARAL